MDKVLEETGILEGEMRDLEKIYAGSNGSYLVSLPAGVQAVYKPVREEQMLWDFPHAILAKREVAAYVVSEMLGWNLVPPTILRDGPEGLGSVQLFVNGEPWNGDAYMLEDSLKRIAVFDIIVNNADRSRGHILVDGTQTWCIDHGICFHPRDKMRSCLHLDHNPLPEELIPDLEAFAIRTDTFGKLGKYLGLPEIAGINFRVQRLLREQQIIFYFE